MIAESLFTLAGFAVLGVIIYLTLQHADKK
jgi:hypothetical protein